MKWTNERPSERGGGGDTARISAARLGGISRIDFACSSLSSSRQTRPVTIAVVVAIAGMIVPAICFVRWRSASLIV